ncbi:MAG: hypothetical protein A3B47_04740 [Candidatus Levybacteria bacterium RIFCSPLOWO2_01_FULL_39_24]|nr:MAG: hypothetical protein A2800_04110 [Candidatus Levybacteria bacterium RIFCSPHIGHO2_01_FULL_40_16]OGH28018.1 MAG: hypothetical protein A3E12_01415 [Candidatus Levybacteria bacterium RIFCSPHIGHO2_12_FULL_39_9]OGH46752.1 MAG: hypothetical protein A3B47_04740 [Candidatus Levybacteria bacterium RIFCSPLOWO2_01_FULL_39_24]
MRKKAFIIIGIFILILFGKVIITALQLSPFFFQLLFNKEVNLKKTQDRVNILLLGIGGGTHDGPSLTDTIIFASLDPNNNKATLVSIPRDLWVPDLTAYDKRINTAYIHGETSRKGGGLILSSAVVGKIINQPIDYAIRIDFDGFVKAVDLLGGINVNVVSALDDYHYPIRGQEENLCGHTDTELKDFIASVSAEQDLWAYLPCRYKHLHVDAGIQQIGGQTALEFVRSRHAEGEQGSDFARSGRQAAVINGIKDKAFSLNVLVNPAKVIGLYDILRDSVDTNIKEDEFDDFIRLATKMRTAKIISAVLDSGNPQVQRSGLLINPAISEKYNNEWVLIPRIGNNNFSEIQKYVECEIKIGKCPIQ